MLQHADCKRVKAMLLGYFEAVPHPLPYLEWLKISLRQRSIVI